MGSITVFALALALGTDAFSLALGMGLTGLRRRTLLLFPLIVAIFHVFMPLIGIYAGNIFGEILGQVAKVIGGIILVIIGARTLYKSLFAAAEENISFSKARQAFAGSKGRATGGLLSLLFLATGVSLDALSVGFSLGTFGTGLMGAVLTMGFVAGGMTALGLMLGNRLGDWLGQRAELLGGLILLGIGLKIMF